jgi:O-antigen ligase
VHRPHALSALALLAAAAPSLLAYNVSPSATLLNQALALGAWGLFVAVAGGAVQPFARLRAPLAALGAIAVGVMWSWLPGSLPATLALPAIGLLAAAAGLAVAGGAARARSDASAVFAAFCLGWVVAGVLSAAVAAVQVFAPALADGAWIARAAEPGRAVGNLRQPNHLSSLLTWAAVAAVALGTLGRLRWRVAAAAFALMVVAIVWSASRTGALGLLVLAAWGLADGSLPRPARRLLASAPAIYALAWAAMWVWSHGSGAAFAGESRLAAADVSSSRFAIWRDTLALIGEQPWAGVGFGHFNLAWTLTPSPQRPTAFFDHAHNLPLHLVAELGVPLGGLVLALLAWALWQAWRRTPGDVAGRAAAMGVTMIGLHSALEYPLWYAYFLLPAAWAWGFALGRPAAAGASAAGSVGGWGARACAAGGVAMVLAAAFTVADYRRVVRIFEPGSAAVPLARRVADGRRSTLFGHHADYAAATSGVPQPDGLRVFDRPAHFLLDTRLMVAWVQALDAAGEKDKARYLAARLREFGPGRAPAIFDGCLPGAAAPGHGPAGLPRPERATGIGCTPPAREVGWRELVGR